MYLTLKPSDPEFEDYNEKLLLLAALKNRHMHREFMDLPEVEANAQIKSIEILLEEMSH